MNKDFEKSFYKFSDAIDVFMALDKLVEDPELQAAAQVMSAKACNFFVDAMNKKDE